MTTVLIVVHIMLVLALIVLILLQRSEGGALGIGGGGGGGGGFMSARGAANALTKTTTILAAGFFATSIALGVISQGDSRTNKVIERAGGQTGVPTGEGGDTNANVPSADSLLHDLERDGQPIAPTTGVPTSE